MKNLKEIYSVAKKELEKISVSENYQKKISLAINDCIICNSKPKKILLKKILYKNKNYINFPVSSCLKCGFGQQLFKFDNKFHNFYYKNIISKNLKINKTILKNNYNISFKRGQFIYEKYNKIIGKKKMRILDLGSGTGGLLKFFEKKGHEVYGIEPNFKYFKYSKNYIKNLINKNFEDYRYPSNFFDLILIIGTLEHVNNPIKTLKEVNRITKKNSIMIVDAKGYPNDILNNYFNFNHHRCFTIKTLNYFLKNYNWKKTHLDYSLEYTKLKLDKKIYSKDRKHKKNKKGNIIGIFKKLDKKIKYEYKRDLLFEKILKNSDISF